MTNVDQLLEIIGLTDPGLFNFYDASLKVLHHSENFSRYIKGDYQAVEPITVEIVPSLDCNMSCKSCTYNQNQSKAKPGKRRLMDPETYSKILESLGELETKAIIFTGGGEPTLNPNLIDYMKLARDSGFEIGLYSNGTILHQRDFVDKVLDLEPTFVRISFNAATSENHALIYGYRHNPDIFRNVVRNTIELGKRKRPETTVGIGYIINETNAADIPLIPQLMETISEESKGGVDYVAIRPEVYYFDKNLDVVEVQPNTDIFLEVADIIEKEVFESVSGMKVLFNKEGFKHLTTPNNSQPNVANPWSASFDYDGRLYITSEHNGMVGFSMGSVQDQTVREIWYGEKRKKLMKSMENGSIPSLHYYKLLTLNELLLKIRKLGTFSDKEVESVLLKMREITSPKHVNFI
jgi:MoaA/NifB/PqqE/SkfB family radical SAM enzyme